MRRGVEGDNKEEEKGGRLLTKLVVERGINSKEEREEVHRMQRRCV